MQTSRQILQDVVTGNVLDTNMCIYLMKHHPPEVAERFSQSYFGEVVISAITLAELEYGGLCSGEIHHSMRMRPLGRAAFSVWQYHLDVLHHALVFMLQNMAMQHILADIALTARARFNRVVG